MGVSVAMSDFTERLRRLAKDQDLEAQVRRALGQRRGVQDPTQAEPTDKAVVHFRRDLPDLSAPQPRQGFYPRSLAAHEPPPAGSPCSGPPVVLHEAVHGDEVEVAGLGKAYAALTPVSRWSDSARAAVDGFQQALAAETSGAHVRLGASCGGQRFTKEDMVFFDLETTGLASCPLFLIGAMTWEGGDLVVRQFFARHYGEEAAVVSLFADLVRDKGLLISFNGKSFDLPFIRARAAANAVPFRSQHQHFDLLHEARKVWRGSLPNCRLQTLEQHLCGRVRTGDIPGHAIPDAYHNYVRTSDASEMVQVLEHNRQDLLTLAELMALLPLPVV